MKKVLEVKKYFSLVRFQHTVFAMPFAVIGFFLGLNHSPQPFHWAAFVRVILCMVFARNAAMAYNRYLDRQLDARNERTAQRDIPTGRVSPREALIFTLLNVFFFVITTAFINQICLFLSPLALGIILGYSFTKRFTHFCHFVLGFGLALAPLGAYLSVTGKFSIVPVLFSAAVLCWVSGFDIIYALQDEDFDKEAQLKSVPVWLGPRKALGLSAFLHMLCIVFLSLPPFFIKLGWLYKLGLLFFAAMLWHQHTLIRTKNLSKINLAFGTTNGVASIVFACLFLLDFFWRAFIG